MFSTRIISFFFLLVSFGLFACAKPIDTTDLAVRGTGDLVTRGGYPENPCGCSGDILDVLLDLKVKLDVSIGLLDGHTSPSKPCDDIIAAINAAIAIIVKIKVDVVLAADLTAIVDVLLSIILSIVGGIGKYGLLLTLTLVLKLDLALSLLVNACTGLLPGLLALLSAALSVHVDLLVSLKFVLTIVACGLGSIL